MWGTDHVVAPPLPENLQPEGDEAQRAPDGALQRHKPRFAKVMHLQQVHDWVIIVAHRGNVAYPRSMQSDQAS